MAEQELVQSFRNKRRPAVEEIPDDVDLISEDDDVESDPPEDEQPAPAPAPKPAQRPPRASRRKDFQSLLEMFSEYPESTQDPRGWSLMVHREAPKNFRGQVVDGYIAAIHPPNDRPSNPEYRKDFPAQDELGWPITDRDIQHAFGGGRYRIILFEVDSHNEPRVVAKSIVKLPGDPTWPQVGAPMFHSSSNNSESKAIDYVTKSAERERDRTDQMINSFPSRLESTLAQQESAKTHEIQRLLSLQKEVESKLRDDIEEMRNDNRGKREEIQKLQTSLVEAERRASTAYQEATLRVKQDVTERHDEEIRRLNEKFNDEIRRLHDEYNKRINDITHERREDQRRSQEQIDDLRNRHREELRLSIDQLEKSNREKIDTIERTHRERMDDVRSQHAQSMQQMQSNFNLQVEGIRESATTRMDTATRFQQMSYEQLVKELDRERSDHDRTRRDFDDLKRNTYKDPQSAIKDSLALAEMVGYSKGGEEEKQPEDPKDWKEWIGKSLFEAARNLPETARGVIEMTRTPQAMAMQQQAMEQQMMQQQQAQQLQAGQQSPAQHRRARRAPPAPWQAQAPSPLDVNAHVPPPPPRPMAPVPQYAPAPPPPPVAAPPPVQQPVPQPVQSQQPQEVHEQSEQLALIPTEQQQSQDQPIVAQITEEQWSVFHTKLCEALETGVIEPPMFAEKFIQTVGPAVAYRLVREFPVEQFLSLIATNAPQSPVVSRAGREYCAKLWTEVHKQTQPQS